MKQYSVLCHQGLVPSHSGIPHNVIQILMLLLNTKTNGICLEPQLLHLKLGMVYY